MNAENEIANATASPEESNLQAGEDPEVIPGERGPSALHRDRSFQSRIGNVFAIALLAVLRTF